MRAIYSYGAAGVIILILAAWLFTGTFVAGGHGPGKGERPLIALFEEEGGPISTAIQESGLAAHHECSGEHIDPHLTIAERVAQNGGSGGAARSVRTQTFLIQPMAIEAPLRGRTKAKASVSVMPETAGVVKTVHVQKGQRVAAGAR
jgi:membrane fusion protein, multidrug efflux system